MTPRALRRKMIRLAYQSLALTRRGNARYPNSQINTAGAHNIIARLRRLKITKFQRAVA